MVNKSIFVEKRLARAHCGRALDAAQLALAVLFQQNRRLAKTLDLQQSATDNEQRTTNN